MPASFEPQALAAQAVAERTYIRHQMAGERKAAHPDADICTDPNCCSAWVSEEDARRRWGDAAEENENRIRAAVTDTDGQVLLYDGAPILAVFHSSSAGVTARSADVWSADVPYLASVASPEGADTVPNYYSVNTFPEAEFRAILLAAHPEASLDGPAEGWIGPVRRNSSDRVEEMTLGGVSLSGTEVRRLFSLRSASFTVEAADGAVTFHVTGYGHGVGMSQYGANEMARQGKTWQEILQWYYTGVTIGTLEG
jgi:stage II sporulation protein D